jgi:hypothetical protein
MPTPNCQVYLNSSKIKAKTIYVNSFEKNITVQFETSTLPTKVGCSCSNANIFLTFCNSFNTSSSKIGQQTMNFVFSIPKPGGVCSLVDGDGVLLTNLAFLSFFFNFF